MLATSGGKADDQYIDESFLKSHKKVLAVVAIVAVASFGYLAINALEGAVVQTSVVMGKVSAVSNSAGQAAGAGPVPSISRVTVAIGADLVDQVIPCSPAPYRVGQSVQVVDQLLRSGQHQYSPDVACKGDISPFRAIYPSQTTTTTSTR